MAAVAAAALVLPAAASAGGLSPWLVGATYDLLAPPPPAAAPESVAIDYAARLPHRGACRGTAKLTLALGADALRRRTVRVGGCRVRAAFRVGRDEIGDAAELLVVRRYRGRTATTRVSVPTLEDERLGSRGLDTTTAPSTLDL